MVPGASDEREDVAMDTRVPEWWCSEGEQVWGSGKNWSWLRVGETLDVHRKGSDNEFHDLIHIEKEWRNTADLMVTLHAYLWCNRWRRHVKVQWEEMYTNLHTVVCNTSCSSKATPSSQRVTQQQSQFSLHGSLKDPVTYTLVQHTQQYWTHRLC